MERYDYLQNVTDSVLDFVQDRAEERGYDEFIRDARESRNTLPLSHVLFNDCIDSDSVTGGASGSYTYNAWVARENLTHNYDLFLEAFDEWYDADSCEGLRSYIENPERADVMIRCYVLPQAIQNAIETLINE